MINAFFGKKLKSSRLFTEAGKSIPVTVIAAEACTITQIKTLEKEGYDALQVGFMHGKLKNVTKPQQGHLKQTGQGTTYTPRFLREIRLAEAGEAKVSDTVTIDQVFQVGDAVKVTGVSKSKGFQGGVKRHGFKGGPRTHGQSDRERAPGSIGQTTTPGRVYRGKRMAGRMGGTQKTITGLKIVAIDLEKSVVTVSGLVPGTINTPVLIQKQ